MSPPLVLPCPSCAALNRVPALRVAEQPRCGRCREPLFGGRPLALDAAGFELHGVRSDLPLLVDFWAPWCGPCQAMAPQFEAAARDLEPRLRLAKVDTDVQPALGARFGIRSIPTLVLVHHGQELKRQAGALTREQIVRWATLPT